MHTRSLLDQLRSRSFVDCDTLDVSIFDSLGPFQDSTSNQAIAYFELREHKHRRLLGDALELSKKLSGKYDVLAAVDIAMTMLALRMLPNLRGATHIQLNPFHSHSTVDIIANAKAIIGYAQAIDSQVDSSRLCLKVPSTWEGLEACRALETEGIKTLATTLFSTAQAVKAGEVGCSYIAPYINELRVHFDTNFKDSSPGFELVPWVQGYFKRKSYSTQVMPASLTSIKEVMALAGANHITVAPHLLKILDETPVSEDLVMQYPSVFDSKRETQEPLEDSIKDEQAFKQALAKGGNGQGERKLNEAIQIFCDFQQNLERIMRDAIEETQQ